VLPRVRCKNRNGPMLPLSAVAKELVSDELWEAIEPLLPEEPPKPKGGRPCVSNRATLAGIIFVLINSTN
jgi:Putative transposase of IS4/5 family (DUF4096)